MSEQIDARGLSCPQPVLLTLEKIKTMGAGQLEVLVDTEASRENVAAPRPAKAGPCNASPKTAASSG
jgi:TusA-related sulfurtransferase